MVRKIQSFSLKSCIASNGIRGFWFYREFCAHSEQERILIKEMRHTQQRNGIIGLVIMVQCHISGHGTLQKAQKQLKQCFLTFSALVLLKIL